MRSVNVLGTLPQTYWYAGVNEKLFSDTQNCDVFSATDNPVRMHPRFPLCLPESQTAVFASGVATSLPVTMIAAPTFNFEISANSKLYQPGACLENHSRNLHSLLCGIFRHGILRNCHNRFSNFSPYKSPADRKSHVLDTSLRTFHSSGRQTLLSLHSYL